MDLDGICSKCVHYTRVRFIGGAILRLCKKIGKLDLGAEACTEYKEKFEYRDL